MPVPLNIRRIRHVHSLPAQHPGARWDWEKFNDAVNGIGPIVIQSGLVHALLSALRGQAKKKPELGHLLHAIRTWLENKDCPVTAEAAAAILAPVPTEIIDPDEKLAAALMHLTSVRDAMAIQAEVIRYLSQAKIVAQAFRKAGPS